MKKLLTVALIVLTNMACGTKASPIKTQEATNISGTRVYLTVPPNFTIASNFTGIEYGNSIVQVYDIIGGSYYTNGATVSKKAFEEQGATVLEYQEMNIAGYPAKYACIQGNNGLRSAMAVFGDSTFCVMISALFPPDDKKIGADIKQCVISARYDVHLKIDPLASAPFILDDSKSTYKFAKSSASMYLYSIDGKGELGDGDALIVVSTIPVDNTVTPEMVADQMTESLQKYGETDLQVKYKASDNVNGCKAYEREIFCNKKGKKAMIYQLVVIKGDKAISILGQADGDFESNHIQIRNLARTIKFK